MWKERSTAVFYQKTAVQLNLDADPSAETPHKLSKSYGSVLPKASAERYGGDHYYKTFVNAVG